ncbi:hypothetical protein C364_04634 [Cryptococcus neoformans Bt63]|nr:hypothetical protein C364_04634 [Cryptococcus neoformans var. grubii Bt63]
MSHILSIQHWTKIKLVAHVLDYLRLVCNLPDVQSLSRYPITSFQEPCELAELIDERFEGFRREDAAEFSKGNTGDEVLAMGYGHDQLREPCHGDVCEVRNHAAKDARFLRGNLVET